MLKKKIDFPTFVEKAKKTHGDKYEYVEDSYVDYKTKMSIICPIHGVFHQMPVKHVFGEGCRQCSYEKRGSNCAKTTNAFVDEVKAIHGDKYDYSNVVYKNNKTTVTLICPTHGTFDIYPQSLLRGCGCKKCGDEKSKEKNKDSIERFLQKVKEKGLDKKFDFSKSIYTRSKSPIEVTCKKCGKIYRPLPNNLLMNNTHCSCESPNISSWEKEVGEYVKSIERETVFNERKILDGKELDIYCPSKRIAYECNGIYYHCEKFKDKNHLLEKTILTQEKNVRLIHIFEDEWKYKKEIVKSIIKNSLGHCENVIFARKCQVNTVPLGVYKEFINKNHLQGYIKSDIRLGLYYNEELVGVIGLNALDVKNDGKYELLRFATRLNTRVIGGASKLFKNFVKLYEPISVISSCDIRLFHGKLYEILGFELDHISKPNYFYIKNRPIRESRDKYNKDILIAKGFDENKTEHQIMLEQGFYRIYDCGNKVYKWSK